MSQRTEGSNGSPTGPPPLQLSIPASADGLAAVQAPFRAYLDGAGLEERLADRAELLLEEVVMNVGMHGFDDSTAAVVHLCAQASRDGCKLVFEDAGRPFDPTAASIAERPTSLEAAEPGGLGLVLLRRMASELAYERTAEGRNRLSLRVMRQAGAAP